MFGSDLIRSMATREQQARINAEERLLEAIVDNSIEGLGGHPISISGSFCFGVYCVRILLSRVSMRIACFF